MRAETLNQIDLIEKTLKLLAQRMDLETIEHRLEEFDALIEAPDLWNDPSKAQKLMKDRQGLIDANGTYKLISSGLRDNVELIELGEAEGDAEIVAEAETALAALAVTAAQKELEALLNGEADSNDTFLEINAGAGRHRKLRLGLDAGADVCPLGRGQGLSGGSCSRNSTAMRRASNLPPTRFPGTTPMAG